MLKANRFTDGNRAETIKVLLQWVKQTPEIAARSLRCGAQIDPARRRHDRPEIEPFIDRMGNNKKRSIDEVRDFWFVRQAWQELEPGK